MKRRALLLPFFICTHLFAQQHNDEQTIRQLLSRQIAGWNTGNIEEFMKGYWESDSLLFIGKNGVTYGYANTLKNYKKSYPDTSAMGKLSFDLIQLQRLSPDRYFVVGKWTLERSIGNLSGHYRLLFRKIKQNWVIVADHSS